MALKKDSKEDKEFQKLPEPLRKIAQSKYQIHFGISNNNLQDFLADIDERLRDIEYTLNKGKEPTLTAAQKVLILEQTGILAHFRDLKLSNNKLAAMLSKLLTGDAGNLEKHIRYVTNPKSKLRIEENYKVLVKFYEELGMEKEAAAAEKVLRDIKAEKGQ